MLAEIKAETDRLLSESDLRTDAWINGYRMLGGQIYCSDSCSNCCSLAVSCTWPEAVCVSESVTDSIERQLETHVAGLKAILSEAADFKSFLSMHRRQLRACPFLADASCTIYKNRPVSCRSLLSTKESKWCGTDFGAMAREEKHAFMDTLDREIVAFPTHYVALTQEIGQGMEAEISGIMIKHLGFAVYGNLPLMVLLNRKFRFAEIVAKGYDATIDFLEREDFCHPFLVSLSRRQEHIHP